MSKPSDAAALRKWVNHQQTQQPAFRRGSATQFSASLHNAIERCQVRSPDCVFEDKSSHTLQHISEDLKVFPKISEAQEIEEKAAALVAEAVVSGKKHVAGSELHSLKPLNKDTNSDGTHFLDELRSYIADKQHAQQQIGDPLHTHNINAIIRIESQRVELQRQQDGDKLSKLKKALSEATLLSHKLARLQRGARTARAWDLDK